MREQWILAIKELDLPVASPYAVSFYTLPRHWKFRQEIAHARAMPNVLPGGDFKGQPISTAATWRVQQETSLDEVIKVAKTVPKKESEEGEPEKKGTAKKGTATAARDKSAATAARDKPATETDEAARKKAKEEAAKKKKVSKLKGFALKLEIKPSDDTLPPPAVLERTFLAVHSPAVKLPPGTLVSISGSLCIPGEITASADGVLLYDSAGGEPLAVRISSAVPEWRKFTLFRRVPASGSIHVTLALTGLGEAYFDNIRIEPLAPSTVQAPLRKPALGWAAPAGVRPAAARTATRN